MTGEKGTKECSSLHSQQQQQQQQRILQVIPKFLLLENMDRVEREREREGRARGEEPMIPLCHLPIINHLSWFFKKERERERRRSRERERGITVTPLAISKWIVFIVGPFFYYLFHILYFSKMTRVLSSLVLSFFLSFKESQTQL